LSILLCTRWDDALIAYAVEKWRATSQSGIGRTVLQKVAYFLKAKGIPVDYEFEMYHYGPYSQELYFRMDDLLVEKIIVDKSDKSGRSQYDVGSQMPELCAMYKCELTKYESEIEDVIKMFRDLKPNEMEILATIHYFHVSLKRFFGTSPTKQLVLEKVVGVKGKKFTSEFIEQAYDIMQQAGLLAWEKEDSLIL